MSTTTETPLDERDEELFRERFHALQDVHGPRVGDFVRFADGRLERISMVYSEAEYGPEMAGVQTSEGGSFYLGNGYCSFSGGLNPSIPMGELDYRADHKRGDVWFFHHDHFTAHNGVHASMDFRVYEVNGCREHIFGSGRDWYSDYVPGATESPVRNLG